MKKVIYEFYEFWKGNERIDTVYDAVTACERMEQYTKKYGLGVVQCWIGRALTETEDE